MIGKITAIMSLVLIGLLALVWYCLSLHEVNKTLNASNKALRLQNKQLREELVMGRIQEKTLDWRRDRRMSDIIVNEE
jgi:hypothetical protein